MRESIDTINLFRSPHDDDREYVHCYCLAIAFYLDHYKLDELQTSLKSSKME